jgi:hypothetical protein
MPEPLGGETHTVFMNEHKREAIRGFGNKLWAMAEKLRGYMDAASSKTW